MGYALFTKQAEELIPTSKKQVTITTDRAEYEQGEDIYWSPHNYKYGELFLLKESCNKTFTTGPKIEEYKDNIWKESGWRFQFLNHTMMLCHATSYECATLKNNFNSIIKTKYTDSQNNEVFLKEGVYRIKMTFGRSCRQSNQKSEKLKNLFTIYSNEFTIVEAPEIKTPEEITVLEDKITWTTYDSSDKSLFDWENYSLQYPSDWHYTEERILSLRKLGALKTVFRHKNARLDVLSIIAGGEKPNSLSTQDALEIRFSDNTFYKYNGNRIRTGQIYYIYKTGTDEEINLGTEAEIIFEFNNTDENIIKKILGSFNLQPLAISITESKIADWKTYRNEEYGFEVKYPEKLTPEVIVNNPANNIFSVFWGSKIIFKIGIYDTGIENQVRLHTIDGSEKEIIIDNIKGLQFRTGFIGEESYIPHTLVKKNNKLYLFLGEGETFNQILSTFKFIEK